MSEERPQARPKKEPATQTSKAKVVPDFDDKVPEGIAKADFHQNLFKPVSTASAKRKRGGKPAAASAKNQLGISAMFRQDPPSQAISKSPTKMSAEKQQLRTSPRRASPAKHDFEMDFSDGKSSDEQMAEPPLEPASVETGEHDDGLTRNTPPRAAPKSLSKYTSSPQRFSNFVVTESTSTKTAVAKSASTLKQALQKTLSFGSK